jgi:hypothetical protein
MILTLDAKRRLTLPANLVFAQPGDNFEGYSTGRILRFNVSTAHVWAELQHQFQAVGKPMLVEDSYIAAIAQRHNLTVATGNVKDFQRPGVRVFDPFTEIDET